MLSSNVFKSRYLTILFHVFVWVLFLFTPFFIFRIHAASPYFYLRELINSLFLIGLFYLNYFLLIPRFFNKKNLGKYFLFTGLSILFIWLQQYLVELYFFSHHLMPMMINNQAFEHAGRDFHHMHNQHVAPELYFNSPFGKGNPPPPHGFFGGAPPLGFIFRKSFISSGLILVTSGFIKIGVQWFNTEKQKEELEITKLNMELKFLKSKIDPHFLFNSLNSVYSLAHKKSEQTEVAILKLSQMMRYLIYDSSIEKVPLEKEIAYLGNYIDFQRLRLIKDVEIDFQFEQPDGRLLIEPMLLIPFVENAFKHGISYVEKSYVIIKLFCDNNLLNLEVKNRIIKSREESRGGIGLDNVKRRLALLYPQRHNLSISEHDYIYKVNLQIELTYD